MKVAVLLVLSNALVFAQNPAGTRIEPATACGPTASFKVNLDRSQHTPLQPEPGKALVYFVHYAGSDFGVGYPTVKVAIDGAWVGANHSDSYFSTPVNPGEHHVCVTLQTRWLAQRVELTHFTAVAGAVYYYRTRLVVSRSLELLEINPVDSDEGKYLVLSFPLSVSQPKK